MENYQKLWVIPTTTTEPVWSILRVLKRWTINIQFKCPWEMNKKNCLASPSDACCSFICKFNGEFSWFNDGDTNIYVIIAVIWPKRVARCESLNHRGFDLIIRIWQEDLILLALDNVSVIRINVLPVFQSFSNDLFWNALKCKCYLLCLSSSGSQKDVIILEYSNPSVMM